MKLSPAQWRILVEATQSPDWTVLTARGWGGNPHGKLSAASAECLVDKGLMEFVNDTGKSFRYRATEKGRILVVTSE